MLLFAALSCDAQNFRIKNYSLGYRAVEIEAVGNNPLTIPPFLKNPWVYQNYLNNQVQYNGITGDPGIQIVRNYSFSTEWYKDSAESRFWRRYTIQTGLFLSNRLTKNMSLENQRFVSTATDTTSYRDVYSLVQKQQFLGISTGINRRIRISNSLMFFTGFQLQGTTAFSHSYQQQWDSSVYHKQVWTTKTTRLPNLKGKNYLQWQALIPLAFELNAYKHEVFLRAEFDYGITGDRYRTSYTTKETDGFSFWLIYLPKH
jgi:hypothetical protein